ncbi:NADH:quinone oxidoreductase [Profundibacter sp.]
MSNENEGGLFSCPVMCWIIGALLGLATYLILSGRFGMSMVVSLIAALVVLVVVAMLLGRLFCRAAVSTHGHTARHDHDIAATRQSVVAADSSGAMVSGVPEVVSKTTSVGAAADSASKAQSAEAEEKPAAKPAAKVASKPAAKKPATKAAKKAATKPARKPVAKDGKPEMLTGARDGGADDLKQIKGVGPKMEIMLNKMGVYHFDQVSGWRAKEVKWVDDNLEGFKGRVSRDEWVKQAKILAKGGKTEFSKKVAKGDVYAKNKK